jgi:hypothetical protein
MTSLEQSRKDVQTLNSTDTQGKLEALRGHIESEHWNVRSMNQGKLEVVKKEMDRMEISILGISELKWTRSGHFESGD